MSDPIFPAPRDARPNRNRPPAHQGRPPLRRPDDFGSVGGESWFLYVLICALICGGMGAAAIIYYTSLGEPVVADIELIPAHRENDISSLRVVELLPPAAPAAGAWNDPNADVYFTIETPHPDDHVFLWLPDGKEPGRTVQGVYTLTRSRIGRIRAFLIPAPVTRSAASETKRALRTLKKAPSLGSRVNRLMPILSQLEPPVDMAILSMAWKAVPPEHRFISPDDRFAPKRLNKDQVLIYALHGFQPDSHQTGPWPREDESLFIRGALDVYYERNWQLPNHFAAFLHKHLQSSGYQDEGNLASVLSSWHRLEPEPATDFFLERNESSHFLYRTLNRVSAEFKEDIKQKLLKMEDRSSSQESLLNILDPKPLPSKQPQRRPAPATTYPAPSR